MELLGDVERYDCKKFAEDAKYLCEEMRHLRDRLAANTSIPPIDISIFEPLERCTQFSLCEIAQRESNVTARGKSVFKQDISREQAEERRDHLHHCNRAWSQALLDIIGKVKESDTQKSENAEETLRAQGKMVYLTAIEYQRLLELEAVIYSKTGKCWYKTTGNGKGC
jgi:hypothetical protein